MLASIFATLILLVRLAMAKAGARKVVATRLAMWILLPVITIATIGANNVVARRRALDLIVAIDAYRARHGDYPKRLEDLVPEILTSVPRAKFTVAFNQFYYSNTDGKPWMMYTSVAPFGRPTYDFTTKRWGAMD